MCGILGGVGVDLEVASLDRALAAMGHRGPDGEGRFRGGGVFLGHRRLAIIDTSAAADQPMTIAGCGTLVFNGEIYDFRRHRELLEAEGIRFETDSDTEVLLRGLARHGVAFLPRLHGMYAFAWLDDTGRRLMLARDHAGMKPLYLARTHGGLLFASEVRTLATLMRAAGVPVRTSAAALAAFLGWGCVPEPHTVLDGVEMLPAASTLEIDARTGAVLARAPVQTAPAAEGLEPALRAATLRHLVADHPVALFLSGGIDSGVLAVEMARWASAPPTAISVALRSRGTDDEPDLVRRLTRRLGMRLHLVELDDWRQRLRGALDAYDQPSIDGLNTFVISGVARELGFKVALSGVGADEVFGGYSNLRARALPAGPLWRRLPGVPLAARLLDRTLSPKLRRAAALLEGAKDGARPQRSYRRVYTRARVAELIPGGREPTALHEDGDVMALERATYLRDMLLRDTDVMSMAHGVEVRAPYLDPAVLAVGASFGGELLRRDKPPKWVLREAFRDALGEQAAGRAKTGFTLDVAGWLRDDGRDLLEDARLGVMRSGLVEPGAFAAEWSRCVAALSRRHPAAWVRAFAWVQVHRQVERWGAP